MGDKRALTTVGGRKSCSKRLNLTGASPASAWLACQVQVSYCSTRQQHLVRHPIIQVATRPGRSSAHVMYSVGTAGVCVPRHAHLCSPLFQVRIAWTTLDILQVAKGFGGRLIRPIKSSSIVSLGTEPWDRLHQKTQTGLSITTRCSIEQLAGLKKLRAGLHSTTSCLQDPPSKLGRTGLALHCMGNLKC